MNKNLQHLIAHRASQELIGPSIVNLGIGIPTLIPKYIKDSSIKFHTENGLLGVTDLKKGEEDPNLINANKKLVGEEIGASYFNSAESFGMIRGGHIDVAILGALEVDQNGLIANWSIPGKNIIGVGGAMDLLSGANKIIITMTHNTKNGNPKLVNKCNLPITSTRAADVIITELGVFKVQKRKLILVDLMPNASVNDIKERTKAEFLVEL